MSAGIRTLGDLVDDWARLRIAMIWERSCDISGDMLEVVEQIEQEINPLLDSAGVARIDTQAIRDEYAWLFKEENE